MKLKQLQNHIRVLAMLAETEAPVVSCYVNLSDPTHREILNRRTRELSKVLAGDALGHLERSMQEVRSYIAGKEGESVTKGVAVFSRGGSDPFFLALDFRVPLPNSISVDTTPNIYHLVEMKDTYHRYIVLIASEERSRIIEVNVGAVTRQLFVDRPELRERVGREWSKEHYQNHRRERTQQHVREKVKVLERLVIDHGYAHLILAGPPHLTNRVRKAMPKSLAEQLVDTVSVGSNEKLVDVVDATLARFVEQEERESLELCDVLLDEVRTGGLAVTGYEDVSDALDRFQVDVLVLSAVYDGPDREEMVRMATKAGSRVEVVNTSEALDRLGGVGALLRYRDY